MHLLLPPSEGKTVPRRGRPCDVDTLSFPGLGDTRRLVLDELARTSARPDALEVLGVGASLADDVARNTRLHEVPAAAAEKVFSGVLYDAYGLDTLVGASRARARRWSLVMTAAYGPVRLTDRIAPYRLSMGARLPGLPATAALWRDAAGPLLDAECAGSLLVDLRSADYVAAWRPSDASRWVAVAVPGASHLAKHTRGLVARALVEGGRRLTRPAHLVEALGGFDVSLADPTSARSPWTLAVQPA